MTYSPWNFRWTVADMDELKLMYFDNKPTAVIAAALGASVQETAKLIDRNRRYLDGGYK